MLDRSKGKREESLNAAAFLPTIRNDDGRLASFSERDQEFHRIAPTATEMNSSPRDREMSIRKKNMAFSERSNGLSALDAISWPSLLRNIYRKFSRRCRSRRPTATVSSRRSGSESAEKTPHRYPPLRWNFGEIYEAVRMGRLSPVADNFILSAADFPDLAVTRASRSQTRATRAFSAIRPPSPSRSPGCLRRFLRLDRCRKSV